MPWRCENALEYNTLFILLLEIPPDQRDLFSWQERKDMDNYFSNISYSPTIDGQARYMLFLCHQQYGQNQKSAAFQNLSGQSIPQSDEKPPEEGL